jgi:uncharacterized protein (DUF305 family)
MQIAVLILGLMLVLAPTANGQQKPATVVQPGAPGEPSKTLPSSIRASAAPVSAADVEFTQGMIMHHQQAVDMTVLIPSHTTEKAMIDLGKRINLSQADEIRFMRHWLEARGQEAEMHMSPHDGHAGMTMTMPTMPGMLTPQQMEALRRAQGKEFDRLFLTGMIQHHRGALTMVKDLFGNAGAGQDAELFDFATDVDNTQRAEINLMEKMLKENR